MSKVKITILASILLLVVIAGYLWQSGFLSRGAPPEKLTIGASVHVMNGLLYIAKHQGFDKAQGLEVAITPYQAGRDALWALRDGLVELAIGAEFVLIMEIFAESADLRCLSVICSGEVDMLIARRDRGISQPEDLHGKTIGLARKTQAEFFLGRFLTLHHIPLKEVTIVDVNPFDQAEALAAGKVDAVLAWEPNAIKVLKQVGNDAISWPAQGGQDFYFLLLSRKEIIKKKAAAMEKLLRALVQAANFFRERPSAAQAIIAESTKVSLTDLQTSPLPKKYELFLDQGLLLAMEDQASWMIHNRLTDQTKIPNFMDYLDPGPLLKVDPKAVRLALPGKAPN
jgi:NitT/TauT family transport system substrate-binding protein